MSHAVSHAVSHAGSRSPQQEAVLLVLGRRRWIHTEAIADALGVSPDMARRYLEALERAGQVVVRMETLAEWDARRAAAAKRRHAPAATKSRRRALFALVEGG